MISLYKEDFSKIFPHNAKAGNEYSMFMSPAYCSPDIAEQIESLR